MVRQPVTPVNISSDDELFLEVNELQEQVEKTSVPEGLKEKVRSMLFRLKRMAKFGGYTEEYEKIAHYVDWIINLPWEKQSGDILDLEKTKQVMDKHHYGMESVKQRILEYIAVLKLNKEKNQDTRAPILFLVGLVGTGKTTLGVSLAEAMGRQLARIPFGGMGSSLDLRGQSRLHPDNEPGKVIKALRNAQTRNPIILLDEIDRVTEEGRADIMGVLVELLDPTQNDHFVDHYVDYPFDLSDAFFIATANNTTHVSTAVLDRMEVLQMPAYTDEEKIVIGRDYVLPKKLKASGLTEDNIMIEPDLWPKIVRPLGYDAGIRTLERTIDNLCRKVAVMLVQGKTKFVHVTGENVKEYLPSY